MPSRNYRFNSQTATPKCLSRHCEPTGRREAPPDDRLREAIHRAARKNGLLRRSAPRNDVATPDVTPRSRGAMRPRFANNLRPENRGRGECRAPDAPAASCALWVTSMHTSIHSEPSENTRHSRTQWFTAYTVLSPVIGFLATVVTRINPQNLTPASGCQDHTSSPSAASNARQPRRRVHRIPPRVRDVASRPSEWDRTQETYN